MDAVSTGGRVRGREGERVGRKAATKGNPGCVAGEAAATEVGAAVEEAAAGGGTGDGGAQPSRDEGKKRKIVGPTGWTGEWRASKNGGWEGEFGGVCKIEACLEALLELVF
jgi:hypothetical protein